MVYNGKVVVHVWFNHSYLHNETLSYVNYLIEQLHVCPTTVFANLHDSCGLPQPKYCSSFPNNYFAVYCILSASRIAIYKMQYTIIRA